jgi:hypothetical protein
VSGPAILRRLHDAGVDVAYLEPDQIVLRGPVTTDLVELAREAKDDLLALVRPAVHAAACTCCGRFFYSEPAPLCFWCRSVVHGDRRYKSTADQPEDGTSVPFVPAFPESEEKRACPGCGGGLAAADPDGGPCWSCRRFAGGAP